MSKSVCTLFYAITPVTKGDTKERVGFMQNQVKCTISIDDDNILEYFILPTLEHFVYPVVEEYIINRIRYEKCTAILSEEEIEFSRLRSLILYNYLKKIYNVEYKYTEYEEAKYIARLDGDNAILIDCEVEMNLKYKDSEVQ